MYKLIRLTLIVALSTSSFSITSYAQDNSPGNLIGGLLGGLIQGAAKAGALKKWQALSPPMQYCMKAALINNNVNFDNAITNGIGPDDARLAQLSQQCTILTGQVLKMNISCNAQDKKGSPVQTLCDQTWGRQTAKGTEALSQEDFIQMGLKGEKVLLVNVEKPENKNARLQEEDRKQKELANSPEGKRLAALAEVESKKQAILAEAKAKKEEADKRNAAAADTARVAKEFPYYAVFYCLTGNNRVTYFACLTGGARGQIEMRNGPDYGMYDLNSIIVGRIPHAQRQGSDLTVDLRSSFEINAQAGEARGEVFGLKIFSRANNKVIFQKEVTGYGVIQIKN